MKRRTLLCLTPAALLPGGASAAADESAAAPVAIPSVDIGKRVVITGRIGEPLGKIVAIKGTFIDGRTTGNKKDDGRILIHVSEAAGRKLDLPLDFTYRDETGTFPQGAGPHPFVGSEHSVFCYETGRFSGIPAEYEKFRPLPQGMDFGFYTELVILSTRSPSTKQK